jgi:D-alanine-D-alanine ligase
VSERRLRIAVLLGGRSSEHAISQASAASVIEALSRRHEVVPVEIGRDGRWALGDGSGAPRELESGAPAIGRPADEPEAETATETLPVLSGGRGVAKTLAAIDVVFPVLHGPFGEDGTVQGLLELANVPYVGAGVAGSAVCMDKDLCKAVLRDRGIPVARNVTLREGDAVAHPFAYPVFVKPARLGSSVGISKVHDASELEPAVELARRHDEKVLIEEFVAGVEVECSVLGNRDPVASLPGEILARNEWYDFEAKYDEGGMELRVPPDLPAETVAELQRLAVDAFVATECEGMARVDFFVLPDGGVILNEINTIPGFTSTSVYAKLFEASGIPYDQLLERLLELAVERHERKARYAY